MKYALRKQLDRIESKLDHVLTELAAAKKLLQSVIAKENVMSQELDNLATQVKANTDAESSAVTLLGQLSDLIKAAGTDPAKLQQLTSDLDASKQQLAAAIVANTPAAPSTPPQATRRHP